MTKRDDGFFLLSIVDVLHDIFLYTSYDFCVAAVDAEKELEKIPQLTLA